MTRRTIRIVGMLASAATALSLAACGDADGPGAPPATTTLPVHSAGPAQTDGPAQSDGHAQSESPVQSGSPAQSAPPAKSASGGAGTAETAAGGSRAAGQPDRSSGRDGPAEPPSPARHSLTFIAMGDDGARGDEIGCGDSAVAVPYTTTTIAPLGEVYRAELAAHGTRDERGEHYDDTDLYNALYRSELHYSGADISGGHATVDLTGDLEMGGECDIPRVRTQLTAPALQFDNVDSVSVRINDQDLDELLSLKN